MIVLSLFDGMSCGRIALERSGVPVTKYFASEIDKYAMQVSSANYPDIVQIGSVTEVKAETLGHIDLLIGGSPCQGFSFAGKQLNFSDPRSALFFEFVRLLKEIRQTNPDVKFLLENVKMKKEYQTVISEQLGVEPIEINSALVSAQNRKRLYWTNIKGVNIPEDKEILFKDIIENGACVDRDKSLCLLSGYEGKFTIGRYFDKGIHQAVFTDKSQTILSTMFKENAKSMFDRKKFGLLVKNNSEYYRKLTPVECERLQTVPDNYTACVSNSQRYKMLGNGWTVDVIVEFFKHLNKPRLIHEFTEPLEF